MKDKTLRRVEFFCRQVGDDLTETWQPGKAIPNYSENDSMGLIKLHCLWLTQLIVSILFHLRLAGEFSGVSSAHPQLVWNQRLFVMLANMSLTQVRRMWTRMDCIQHSDSLAHSTRLSCDCLTWNLSCLEQFFIEIATQRQVLVTVIDFHKASFVINLNQKLSNAKNGSFICKQMKLF